jgi:peptide/nickel transport system ATP-binding protein
MLSVRDLTLTLPPGADRALAVEKVDLEVAPDEIVCVVGESGSGKSLTAHAVMRLLPRGIEVAGGQVLLAGEDLLALPPAALRGGRGRDVAMIFQDPMAALNPVMPVGRQIGEQIRAHEAVTERAARQRAVALLDQMGLAGAAALAGAYPHQLSGGQRQRVMIAMALSLGPRLLIADEPTTALDVTTQAQILRLIRRLKEERRTSVLFITHDFGLVADLADRVVVMRQGRVVEAGAARAVLEAPAHPYTRALIAAIPEGRAPAPPPPQAVPLVQASGLSKRYRRGGLFSRRGETALENVELVLHRGETLGIVGESGSGKSTLARCLVRLLDPDAGRILLDGRDWGRMKGQGLRDTRRRIQMVFQDPYASLNPRHRVGRILTAGPRAQGEDKAAALARAGEMIRLVGLPPESLRRFPHEFSGGQRQRIALARALMLRPDVLVADEPVSALDMTMQAQILALLDDVRRRMDLAMLFITHDMRVAAQICHRVMVMRRGRVVECGPARELFEAPRDEYTKALLEAIPGRGLGGSSF